MGRFKKFFSRNKSEEVVETQEIQETPDMMEEQEEPAEEEAGMPLSISAISSVGYNDAMTLLTEAFGVHYWHDVEIDEEDLPETEDELLLACRRPKGEKGFDYRVGKFETFASAWKEIRYVDPSAGDVELDETFVERRLQQIEAQLPPVPDFSLIKRAYINGFGEGSRYMKRIIQDFRWHAVADVEKEIREMDEEVLTAIEEDGTIRFAVVNQDVFTMDTIDSKYIAWANIEPFDSVMDHV